MDIWTFIKWGLVIWLGPHVLSFLLKLAAVGAVGVAHWLDRWPL